MSGVGIVIMASGFSKRFGRSNKLLMPLREKTIIEVTVENVLKAKASEEISLVTQYKEIEALYENLLEVQVIKNERASQGISASIFFGINSMPKAQGYMFVSGDQVLLRADTIRRLIGVFEIHPNSIVVPIYDGAYGGPKIFPASLKSELMALQGDKGGRGLIQKYRNIVVEVPIEDSMENWDIDTFEDYTYIKERFK